MENNTCLPRRLGDDSDDNDDGDDNDECEDNFPPVPVYISLFLSDCRRKDPMSATDPLFVIMHYVCRCWFIFAVDLMFCLLLFMCCCCRFWIVPVCYYCCVIVLCVF